MRVWRLPPQRRGVGGSGRRLLSGGRFGDFVGQAGAAGAGHGRGAAGGGKIRTKLNCLIFISQFEPFRAKV